MEKADDISFVKLVYCREVVSEKALWRLKSQGTGKKMSLSLVVKTCSSPRNCLRRAAGWRPKSHRVREEKHFATLFTTSVLFLKRYWSEPNPQRIVGERNRFIILLTIFVLFLKRRPTSQRIVGERKPVRYFADNFRVVSEEATNIPGDCGRKETGSLFCWQLPSWFSRGIMIIDRFYIALFSSLEQTHCAYVVCDSEWVTVFFYNAYF